MKPTGEMVARQAISTVYTGYTYDEMDCQAFVEHAVRQAGGSMDYRGSNDMARHMQTIEPLTQARRKTIKPGELLFIHTDDEANLPQRYRGDGAGDFSHVGIYLGPDALTDRDKNGRLRSCDVAHSSASMGRTAGSTLANGWTHVGKAKEIDYGDVSVSHAEDAFGIVASETGEELAEETSADVQTAEAHAVVTSPDGNPVKLRKSASTREPIYWQVAAGTKVLVERTRGNWSLIRAECTDGHARRAYMMTQFLEMEG